MNPAETQTGVLLALAKAGPLPVTIKINTGLEEGTIMDFAIRTADGADTAWTMSISNAISMEHNLTGLSTCDYSYFH